MFESHPLTICIAPSATSCSEGSRGLLLGARVQGPWTRALNELAREQEKGVQISVMLDGPYGGCSIDLADYENVLLVAGGSGVTFTLGMLDDLVGRIVKHGRAKGERTRRVEFAWCIRSFGTLVTARALHSRLTRSRRVHILVCAAVPRHRKQGEGQLDRRALLNLRDVPLQSRSGPRRPAVRRDDGQAVDAGTFRVVPQFRRQRSWAP